VSPIDESSPKKGATPRIVICDLDGTIALHSDEARGHFEYHKAGDDDPHPELVELVGHLHEHYDVVFVTGREEQSREVTTDWLGRHLGDWAAAATLLMRKTGDYRRDDLVKQELHAKHLATLDIAFVLDDRDRVVTMWRDLGLVCLQVAPGDF